MADVICSASLKRSDFDNDIVPSATIQTVNLGASVRPFDENRRRRSASHYQTMSSSVTSSGRPSVPLISKKRSLTATTINKTRTPSDEEFHSPSKRPSATSFHYQTLTNGSPAKTDPLFGRSLSSNNAELIGTKATTPDEILQQPFQSATTTELVIEVPKSIRPQITIERDSWDHKIEFLLAVIGYAVDLGRNSY